MSNAGPNSNFLNISPEELNLMLDALACCIGALSSNFTFNDMLINGLQFTAISGLIRELFRDNLRPAYATACYLISTQVAGIDASDIQATFAVGGTWLLGYDIKKLSNRDYNPRDQQPDQAMNTANENERPRAI